ncbi:putative lipoprotein [Serinibacter arcticus]|uniref:Putative lipoprotein n=1 Tax=Serinibacter arcticus TaxID=1655435 RepID=A0A4Z1E3U8_9MICO|nr:putative lipoprotein [Serinibacter arcticus]
MPSRTALALPAVLVLLAALAACSPGSDTETPPASSPAATDAAPSTTSTPAPAPTGEPLVLLAVGDSLTTGFASCATVVGCQAVSWAVGTDPEVDSIGTRLGGAGYAVTTVEAAVEGARMAEGVELVDAAFAEPGAPGAADVDVVTVLLGANDVCEDSPASMTTAADYGVALGALLDHVASIAPDAGVVVASIPHVTSVWDVASGDPEAAQVWGTGLCSTVLGGDAAARAAADERLTELQAVAVATCAEHPGCRTDDGAVAAVPVTTAWLSTFDHFHPSVLGQAALAEAVWPAVESALPAGTAG